MSQDNSGAGSNKLLWLAAIAIAAVAFFFIGKFTAGNPGLFMTKDSTKELAKAAVDSDFLPVVGSPAKGNATAPVTAVIFSDYQCPGCMGLSTKILESTMKKFGPSKLRVVLKSFPLPSHPDAARAAKAAWAAQQQNKFWEYNDRIYKAFPNQKADEKTLNEEYSTFLSEEKLIAYATELKLDVEKFKTDMNSPQAEAALAKDIALGNKLGVNATPSVFINGRRLIFKDGITADQVIAGVADELKRVNKLSEVPNASYAFAVMVNRSAQTLAETAPSAASPSVDNFPSDFVPSEASTTGPNLSFLPTKGNPNALVTIVAYSEFQCPFCARVEPTLKQLLQDYPNEIKIAFAHMPLGFHDRALPAAKAAFAAQRQGKFWEYHDLLFANQSELSDSNLESYAEQLGLDMAKFKADMNSETAAKFIQQNQTDAKPFDISGTPSFLINGVVFVGAQPISEFKKIIDAEIARAKKVAEEKKLSGDALYKELVKTAPKPAPEEEEAEEEEADRVFVELGNSPIMGNPNAPITIVEFTDFECPFCSKADNTIKELMKNNPDKIRLVFKHFPLDFHKNAFLAHRAAEIAKKQNKFWEFYSLTFENQRNLQPEDLIKYAEQAGLNVEEFKKDLDNEEFDNQVQADKRLGGSVDVQGTPHFFINGKRLSGARPLENFQAVVDQELEIAKSFLDKGTPQDKLYETVVKSEAKPEIVIPIGSAPFKGPEDAQVTIFQFSEFQCPFCSRVEPTIEQILEAYPGKVKVVFKHFPLDFHDNAHLAAQASIEAQKQGKFWEYHKILFDNQSSLDKDSLIKYAEQLNLDMTKFKAALDNETHREIVDQNLEEGKNAGISGTPSFIINGKKVVGAQPFDNFKREIDAALSK